MLWLGLTALDGRTYHLAPALIAAAPAIAARLLGLPADRGGVVAVTLALAGITTVLAAWGLLELAGILPTATLWAGQPGGVRAEIAVSAALGALAGTLVLGRAPHAAALVTGKPGRRQAPRMRRSAARASGSEYGTAAAVAPVAIRHQKQKARCLDACSSVR